MVRSSLLLYVGVVTLVVLFEPRFIFFPTRFAAGQKTPNDLPTREGQVGVRVEDCFLVADDGVRLHGWFCSPVQRKNGTVTPVSTQTTVLFLHGNGGNLSDRYDAIRQLVRFPVCVFVLDYRGYGKSEGTPSEAGLYRDARAAWRYLIRERGVGAEEVVLFGESLGGAVAINLATDVKPAGVVVQASFTSLHDMATLKMPFVPPFLVRTRMDSLGKVARLPCPKLFIHGTKDATIPNRMSRRLFAASSEPKQLYPVEGAGHNDVELVGGADYYATLRRFIGRTQTPRDQME